MQNFATIWRVNYLDDLELLSGNFQKKIFPWHSHETYCLSIIEKGEEAVEFKGEKVILTPGDIFLLGANTIHRNFSFAGNSYLLRTFYISPDVIRFLDPDPDLRFSGYGKVTDKSLFEKLIALHKKLENYVDDTREEYTLKILQETLLSFHKYYNLQFTKKNKLSGSKVYRYIEDNLGERLLLEDLAAIVKLDKFRFIRSFKKDLGITPIEYVLNRRLERAKVSLKNGKSIVSTAIDFGFYDQSHFSNYFKKYIGVTPLSYQKGCNILQE